MTDVTNNLPIDASNIPEPPPETQEQRRTRGQTRPAILAADLIDEIEASAPKVKHEIVGALEDNEVAAQLRRIVALLDRADRLPVKTRRFVVLTLSEE